MADDDEDMGSSFLKNHMSEAQTNYLRSPGPKGVNSGGHLEKDSDRAGKYEDWGGIDQNPYRPQSVNRRGKGDKG